MSTKQWIAGINAVSAAVEHDAENVREVLIEAGAKNPRVTEIETAARRKDIDVRRVATQALEGVVGNLRHQGVVARYAAAKTFSENDLQGLIEAAEGKALVLVLDGVQDPHNLGACLRSAAAAGATAVIFPKDKAVQINATVRKTSAGAADSIPVIPATNLVAHAARPAAVGRVDLWPGGRSRCVVLFARPARQCRPGARRRSRRPASAYARELRPTGQDPDAGRQRCRKPQCVGGQRRDPVRSGASARLTVVIPT